MQIAIVASAEPGVESLGLRGDFESNLMLASKLGYNGVELLVKDPDKLDTDGLRETTQRFNLSIPAIGTGLTYTIYGLSLSSPNRNIREKAVKRIEGYLKVGRELDSAIIIGSVKGKVKNHHAGIKNLKDSLRRCTESAEDIGTYILIEPLNRYESNFINTIGEAIDLMDEIGSERIGVMADTFHMNIEEKTIYDSIIKAGSYLKHIHFADSNRLAPGQGHIDFRQIMDALREVNYDYFISAEILPLPSQHDAARLTIEHLKRLL